jgi:peptide deformylase
MDVLQLGNPILRQQAIAVLTIPDPALTRLVEDLMTTLLDRNGVGIAAPQVGISQRVLIVASRPNPRYPDAPEMPPIAMVNPRLLAHGEEIVRDWEGCLSVPERRGLVPRYQAIEVEYTTPTGDYRRQKLTGFVARIFQHELDHLDGVVFLDRLEAPGPPLTQATALSSWSQKQS